MRDRDREDYEYESRRNGFEESPRDAPSDDERCQLRKVTSAPSAVASSVTSRFCMQSWFCMQSCVAVSDVCLGVTVGITPRAPARKEDERTRNVVVAVTSVQRTDAASSTVILLCTECPLSVGGLLRVLAVLRVLKLGFQRRDGNRACAPVAPFHSASR